MPKTPAYKLIPRPVPTRERSSFYKQIVNEFLASKEQSVAVEETDRKPVTLVQGLRKALQSEERKNVRVVQRSNIVYLAKL
jgi:hypothetical protein